jgi:hypothetical protein
MKSAKLMMLVLALAVLALVAPAVNAATVQNPVDVTPVGPVNPPTTGPGVNIDVPFTIDPICGFQIIVQSSTPPVNFYNGVRNPWGAPSVQEVPVGSGIWVLTFGPGPCFSPNDPRFFENGVFKGLHFGFWTSVTLVQFQGAPCWLIGQNGSVPCTGITGHIANRRFVDVLNGSAQAVAVQNAAIAVSAEAVPINNLTRGALDHLSWEPLRLDDNFVPAAAGSQPGTLRLNIPEHIRSQRGFAVFSYDITDTETSEVLSTVTLEVPLQ